MTDHIRAAKAYRLMLRNHFAVMNTRTLRIIIADRRDVLLSRQARGENTAYMLTQALGIAIARAQLAKKTGRRA